MVHENKISTIDKLEHWEIKCMIIKKGSNCLRLLEPFNSGDCFKSIRQFLLNGQLKDSTCQSQRKDYCRHHDTEYRLFQHLRRVA